MAPLEPGLPPPKLLRESTGLTSSSTFTSSSSSSRSFSYTPNAVTFTHTRTRTHFPFVYSRTYRILHQPLFRNSLLAGVGYLELANAADFAANVWNQIPVPLHAKILMAIGGPCALCMTLVAARDMYLSAANVRLLRQERSFLAESISTNVSDSDKHLPSRGKHKAARLDGEVTIGKLNAYKHGVNTREVLTEVIDRILMDLLMGIGALLVGIGTLLAIWGADRTIYRISNLLSGYVGNGLAAGFGLVNAVWSVYLVWRFQQCWAACSSSTSSDEVSESEKGPRLNVELPAPLKTKLRARMRALQVHALVNGINGLVAGAASMVTATMWYGYVVLVPCIVSLILLNVFWRARLGYDRSLGTFATGVDLEATTSGITAHTHIPEDSPATYTSPDHQEDAQPQAEPSASTSPSRLPARNTLPHQDTQLTPTHEDAISILLTELAYVSDMHRALLHTTASFSEDNDKNNNQETQILRTLQLPTAAPTPPTTFLTFIIHHNLWESFCVWLVESQTSPSPSLSSVRKRLWGFLRCGRQSCSSPPAHKVQTTEAELAVLLGLNSADRNGTSPAAHPPSTRAPDSLDGESPDSPAEPAASPAVSVLSAAATEPPAGLPATTTEVTLHPSDLLTRCRDPDLLARKMKAFLVGNVTRCFAYRERYLLEMVGFAIWKESVPSTPSRW